MDDKTTSSTEQGASCGTSGFNYCLFSKSIIALPALSVVAYVPTTFFSDPSLQIAGAIFGVAFALAGAYWLDHLPSLQKKLHFSCVKPKH